jgi:hydrophobic/amphiphilic exporter-1 (mainly G- bacteria), HAE1 family
MLHTSIALKRPVTTAMTFIALIVIGMISVQLLRLEEFPDVTFPGMQVIIPYPGSTPEEVEQLITRPVEEALSTLAGIEELRSRSEAEQATFQIQFDWGRDIDAAAFDVRTKLDSIRSELPAGADRILAFSFNASDQPVVVVRISADQDLTDQYDSLERYLKRPLERVPGVARVELQGVVPREVRILINAGRMAAHNIDVQQLATLLQKSNFSVSAGEITEQGQRFSIRPIGEFRSLDDIRNLRVTSAVRLADIADVALVAPELEMGRHLDNRPAVGLDVFKTTQANVVETVDAVLKEIERARTLPQLQGISIIVIGNQAESIRNSLGDLRDAGLIGLVLAIAVLFFFLRDWPMTAIVALAVPGSLLITLAALYFLGLTLNIFSMMGMMLAIGMLVDNAVVITESVFRHRQLKPADPLGATLRGVRDVGVATLAGTLATIIVFVPLVFGSPSEITILMKHVAIPIVIAMVASLLVAQTIIPMLSARINAPLAIASGSFLGRLQNRYAAALQWVLANPGKTGLALIVIIASPVALFATKALKVDPFPQDAGRGLFLDYHLKGTHPLEQVEQAVDRIEAYLLANRERFDIQSVYSRYDTTSAQTLLQLTPRDAARVRSKDVMQWVADEMPEILIGEPSFQFDQQGPGKGFSLQLSGDSTERLYELSFEVARQLATLPGLEGVHSEARSGDEQVHIVVDRDRAAQLNVTSEMIASTVAAAMRGDRLRELRTADREVTMRLLFRATDRQAIEDLASLPITLPDKSSVSLGSIATFRVEPGDRAVERINRLTSVVIAGNLTTGTTFDEIKKVVEPIMKSFPLPPGYTWKFGRGAEQNDETVQTMLVNILLAFVMIYLVMAALFESTLLPVSILSSILFAIVGVFWFLFATVTPLTFMAMIGILILMGVVVNNGIVLVAHIAQLRATGMERTAAIIQAGRDRLRPILMTTLTTLLAMLPLAIGDAQVGGGSNGGPAYYPMARAIIGGLGFSTLVSLLIVPSMYVWLDNAAQWTKRLGGSRAARPTEAGIDTGPSSRQPAR